MYEWDIYALLQIVFFHVIFEVDNTFVITNRCVSMSLVLLRLVEGGETHAKAKQALTIAIVSPFFITKCKL